MSPTTQNLFILTPNDYFFTKIYDEEDGETTHIWVWAYPLAGIFLGSLGMVQIPPAEDLRFVLISETHRTLHEGNKLLLTPNDNHEGNQVLGEWWKEAVLNFKFVMETTSDNPSLLQKQLILSFDVRSYKTNKVQIFVGDLYKREEVVNNRRLVSILLDPIPDFNVFLRVVYPKSDLYIYQVRCDCIEV